MGSSRGRLENNLTSVARQPRVGFSSSIISGVVDTRKRRASYRTGSNDAVRVFRIVNETPWIRTGCVGLVYRRIEQLTVDALVIGHMTVSNACTNQLLGA